MNILHTVHTVTSHRHLLLFFFPILLAIFTVVRLFIFSLLQLTIDPTLTPIINSKSFLNIVFAGHCFEIYLILFLSISAYIYCNKNGSYDNDALILPLTTRDLDTLPSSDLTNKQFFLKLLVKLIILYFWLFILIIWFFGPSLFQRVHSLTGGHCISKPGLDYVHCKLSGGEYIGGFKISGHSLIATCFSTCLTYELGFVSTISLINGKVHRLGKLVFALGIFVLCAWIILFSITAIFYHTLPEKILGTLFGLVVPWLLYIKYSSSLNVLM